MLASKTLWNGVVKQQKRKYSVMFYCAKFIILLFDRKIFIAFCKSVLLANLSVSLIINNLYGAGAEKSQPVNHSFILKAQLNYFNFFFFIKSFRVMTFSFYMPSKIMTELADRWTRSILCQRRKNRATLKLFLLLTLLIYKELKM